MKHEEIAGRIDAMYEEDMALRRQLVDEGILGDGYDVRMEAVHVAHARELATIIDSIGLPTKAIVGNEAAYAAWVIIQHAISVPAFMRRCAVLFEEAADRGEADPVLFAYLSDRIAVFEGRAQRYGTQFDWDDEGQMSVLPCDDVSMVDGRRAAIGLPSLADETAVRRRCVREEGQRQPQNRDRHRQEEHAWKQRVGWV